MIAIIFTAFESEHHWICEVHNVLRNQQSCDNTHTSDDSTQCHAPIYKTISTECVSVLSIFFQHSACMQDVAKCGGKI